MGFTCKLKLNRLIRSGAPGNRTIQFVSREPTTSYSIMVGGKIVAYYGRRSPWMKLVASLIVLLVLYELPGAGGTRVRLGHSDEPHTAEAFNNMRMLLASRKFYYLKSAGLLNESELGSYFLEDKRGPDGRFLKGNFDFNSSDMLRRALDLRYVNTLQESVTLHVYDDPLERDLAAGPQVDQELCGLHLEYTLHMMKKHLVNFSNSSELSIFTIMNTFGIPGHHSEMGTHVSIGDYRECKQRELNVMRSELAQVDKRAAEKYFKNRLKIVSSASQPEGLVKNLKTILTYLGPFVGFPLNEYSVNMDKYAGDVHLLPTKYCMLAIRWPEWSNSTYRRRTLSLRSGACLPETCDSKSLQVHGVKLKQIVDFKMTNYLSGYYIEDLYCLPDENSKLRNPFEYTSTTLFIVSNVIWLTLTLFATSFKMAFVSKRKQSKSKSWAKSIENEKNARWWIYLNSWCLTKNVKDFLAAKRGRLEEGTLDRSSSQNGLRGNKVDLNPLEGFKVISSIAVITSHACMVGFVNNWNLSHANNLITKSWLAVVHIVCPAVVDNFFVVTGIMMAKILFQTPRKVLMAPGFWVRYALYRYARIVPLYLLVHWFLKSYFRFIGSGPLWDYGTSHTAWSKVCQDESYWRVILPTVNFKSPARTCNGVGWYLANDIQFAIITPVFILLYLKSSILGHLTIFSSVTLIMVNHVRYYYTLDTDTRGSIEPSVMSLAMVTDDATEGYVYPQYRCVSYLIGLAAGHVLVEYERGTIKKWPRWFLVYARGFFYLICYILCFMPYIASLLPYENKPLIKLIAAVFSGTLHGVTSIAAAIFTLLLCTGHMPSLAHLFNMSGFRPLANISLSTLLVHIPLLFYSSQSLTDVPELTVYQFVTTNFLWCVESFLIAIVVHVLYELPLRRFLIKLMINIFSNSKNPKPSGAQNAPNKSKTN